jgi:hypothetical protein
MDYKLAKRLKDAGWPQPEVSPDPDENQYPGKFVFEHDDFDAEDAYAPTTDELIEALILTGWSLEFSYGPATRKADHRWEARCGFDAFRHGANLRIVLAELWLTPEVQAELRRLTQAVPAKQQAENVSVDV